MLGITLPDAIAVSTLIIAVLAAWRGARVGGETKTKVPPENTFVMAGAAFADSQELSKNTAAINRLSEAAEDIVKILEKQMDNDSRELIERVSKIEAELHPRRR